MRVYKKTGIVYPHKTNCTCFRCTGQAWNKGIKRWWSSPTEFKKGEHYSRATEFKRKNIKLGYYGLHEWVYKKLGKAKDGFCEFCGKPAQEWANKSHKYKKRINDWMALCRFCHKKYDFDLDWGAATRRFPELRREVLPV